MESLEKLTYIELRTYAKKIGLKKFTALRKDQLIEKIKEYQNVCNVEDSLVIKSNIDINNEEFKLIREMRKENIINNLKRVKELLELIEKDIERV